jgi:hypothetical protein
MKGNDMEDKLNFKGTRLTLEIDGEKLIYETPHSDLDAMDILRAFYGEMIGHTFHPVTLVNVMRELSDVIEESLDKHGLTYSTTD